MENLILHISEEHILIASFILLFCNGFISFPPSEISLSLIGITCFTLGIPLFAPITLGIMGNVLGTSIWYFLGVKIGYNWIFKISEHPILSHYPLLQRATKYILPNRNQLDILLIFVKTKCNLWIGILRCFPLIRSIISLPAGILKMKIITFFIYTTIGISIWTIGWVIIGYNLGDIYKEMHLGMILIMCFVFIGFLYILKAKLKKWLESTDANNA